jgi:hypothetical protein
MTQHVTETATRESRPQENGADADGSRFTWPFWLPKVQSDDELWMWHLAMRWMENDFAVVLTQHQIAVVNGYIAGLPPEPRHEVLGGINYELWQLQRPPDWPDPFRFRVFLRQVLEYNEALPKSGRVSSGELSSGKEDWLQQGDPPEGWPRKRICGLLRQLAKWEGTSEKTLKAHNRKGVRWWIIECGGSDDETGSPTPFAIYYPSEAKFQSANSRRRADIDATKTETIGRKAKKSEAVRKKPRAK